MELSADEDGRRRRDTYFGKTYKDPYRWLENLKDKEVEAWFKAQAELTDDSWRRSPARDALAEEWMELDKLKPARYSSIAYENGRVFYKKTLGGENVGKLYFREGWKGAEKLLFDPARSSLRAPSRARRPRSRASCRPGRHVTSRSASPPSGAEFSEIRILDVDKRHAAAREHLSVVRPARLDDGQQVASSTTPGKVTDIKSLEIELNRKTRLHTLGTDVAARRRLLQQREQPRAGHRRRRNFRRRSIDESYPDIVIGNVGTVQNEMRVFYAPAVADEEPAARSSGRSCARLSDNLVRGIAFYKGSGLRRHPRRARRATSWCARA